MTREGHEETFWREKIFHKFIWTVVSWALWNIQITLLRSFSAKQRIKAVAGRESEVRRSFLKDGEITYVYAHRNN